MGNLTYHSWRAAGKVCFILLFLLLLLFFNPTRSYSAAPNLVINEVMVSNAEYMRDPDFNNYAGWIEIYNAGSSTINLKNYFLTDDLGNPLQWQVNRDNNISPGGFALFWTDGEDYHEHTNFKLKHNGEDVGLFMPDGTLVDSITYSQQVADVSFGRKPNAGTSWYYFQNPTPGASNTTTGLPGTSQAGEPQFSAQGGFYNNPFTLTITPPSPSALVTYTLDGKVPTSSSTPINGSIPINQTTIVRARVFNTSLLNGPVVTHTYFIGESSTLPVFSIVTDPSHFFDDYNGIYVIGKNGIDVGCPAGVANFFQSWERPISLEFYENDGSLGFQFNSGIEIFGGCGRRLPIKGLDVKLDSRYGTNKIQYDLFPGYYINEFKAFLLRPSSQDQFSTMFRDGMVQTLIDGRMDVDKQAYRPAILFLNGAYWGIHNIREKQNDDYLEYHHNETDTDLINNRYVVKEGTLDAFNTLEYFIVNHDLTIPANYSYVASKIDIDDYINYQVAEHYSANRDWPDNNIRTWRPRRDDGQWRWMFYDLDKSWLTPDRNMMTMATKYYDEASWANRIFPKLIQNTTFRDTFLQRFASHMNTTYETNRVLGILESIRSTIAPEMPRHTQRWGVPTATVWNNDVETMRVFARQRKAYVTEDLLDFFNISGMQNLTVNVTGSGKVLVSEVEVPTPSYSGPYFKGIPIRLTAVPDSGNRFVGWQELGISDVETNITLNANYTITAIFETLPPPPEIVINEIHYNPADAQGLDDDYEFLELVNNSGGTVALDGFVISDGIDFTFPSSTSIAGGEYILLAKNATTYSGLGCQVFQWVDSSLANSGENVQLDDQYGTIVDLVPYSDSGDWPGTADGGGPSLELKGLSLDNSLPSNWQSSAVLGGSPCAVNSTEPPGDIVINELHYNPADAQGIDDDFEFIELLNVTAGPVDLSGFIISDGIEFTFPAATSLAGGAYMLLAKNAATYNSLGCPVFQWTAGSLSNGGENVQLDDAGGLRVDVVPYSDGGDWPTLPDGDGPSLELANPLADNSLPANWHQSSAVGGSPCAPNSDGNINQDISLAQGWNLISSNVAPAAPALETLLAGIESNLEIMKNDEGEVYWPSIPVNDIVDWDARDGYQIFMNNADILTISGLKVDADDTPIALLAGWNTISYLPGTTLPVDQALAGISGSLVLVKNGAGELYWPEYGVNQIGNMQPGEGYQLYTNSQASLLYSGN